MLDSLCLFEEHEQHGLKFEEEMQHDDELFDI